MDLQQWTQIFQTKAVDLKQDDSWRLQFDNSIVHNSPNPGWVQYIKKTSAWFKCTLCGRGWPSNRVMVLFNMRLTDGQGVVKVRPYRQNCKMCSDPPMENPDIEAENIEILMEILVKKIRIKCYHEDLGEGNRFFRSLDVRSPHEPAHCEACQEGCCTQN